MTEQNIKALEQNGFKRWTKGSFDRMYINASALGLECDYYKTGNIHYAEFKGEHISNCEARRMKEAKTYVDVQTGKVFSGNSTLKEACEELVSALTA